MLPVTVVIPIYNHAGFIEQCLRSIVQSGRPPAEIVMVDNGSTDGSVDVAAALDIPGLTIIRNGENVGATRARHIGSRHVRTPYLSFLDSDDYLGPDALGLALDALDADRLDFSLFTCLRVNKDNSRVDPFIGNPDVPVSGSEAFELTLGAWKIHAYGLFGTAMYMKAMDRFEVHGFSDDEVLARHLFLSADRVGGSRGLYHYRDVPKSYTFDKVAKQTRTNLRVLALASDHRARLASDAGLREMRNVVVRNFAGLVGRLVRAGGDRAAVADLWRDYARLSIPWRASDAKYRALHLACALAISAAPIAFRSGR